MNIAIEIGYLLLTVAVSFATFWMLRRGLEITGNRSLLLSMPLGISFLMGYALLPEQADLIPRRHWHWLPYLCLSAGLLGPLGSSKKLPKLASRLTVLIIAAVAAWLLVPAWSSLQPPRLVYVPLLAVYLLALIFGARSLRNVVSGKMLAGSLVLTSMAIAIGIAAWLSLLLGKLAATASASLLGCWLLTLFHDAIEDELQGWLPAAVTLVAGLAFTGYIEPEPPLFGLLLVPAVPLGLHVFRWPPLTRLQGMAAVCAQVAVVVFGLALAMLVLMLAT